MKKNNQGQYCGNTDHFTSFAILLQGKKNNCNKENEELDSVITYLSLASVAFAFVIAIIIVIAYELHFQHKKILASKQFKSMARRMDLHKSVI